VKAEPLVFRDYTQGTVHEPGDVGLIVYVAGGRAASLGATLSNRMEPARTPEKMCGWCGIDTDRTRFDPIGAIDIECAIGGGALADVDLAPPRLHPPWASNPRRIVFASV